MNKNFNTIQRKNENLYFLYVERQADVGITDKLWHNHPFYEIIFFSEGESEHAIENRRYPTKGGDVLLVRPYRHHFEHTRLAARSASFYLGFFPEAISNGDLAEELFKKGEHLRVGCDSVFAELMNTLKNKFRTASENDFDFLKSMIEAAIFALCDSASPERSELKIKSGVVGKIIEYVNVNLKNIQTITDISESLFFSASYVRDSFKREMGIGIMQYVRNKKVVRAHERIRNGEKPTEIFNECGFTTYSSFYRAHVAYFGFPPKTKKN